MRDMTSWSLATKPALKMRNWKDMAMRYGVSDIKNALKPFFLEYFCK
jgi:hypothetical protein